MLKTLYIFDFWFHKAIILFISGNKTYKSIFASISKKSDFDSPSGQLFKWPLHIFHHDYILYFLYFDG